MQHHIEVEAAVLAGVVHPDVQVELLLPQDDAVGDLEVVLPHAVGEVTVAQGEDGLDVPARHPLRPLLQRPLADPGEAVVGRPVHAVVPLSELREDEGDAAADGFPSVEHGLFTDKQLLLKAPHVIVCCCEILGNVTSC